MSAPDPVLGEAIATDERCVAVRAADALVLADLHFGRGAASNVDAPLAGGAEAVDRLEALLERTSPSEVVVAGDLLHSFSWLPRGVEDDLRALEAAVERAGATLVVTPGNHDSMLAEAFDGDAPAAYRLADGETVVCHGHEPPEAEADRYVVGHEHPALSIDGRKHPCFLFGPDAYDGADVLVLPAFTRLALGTKINGMRTGDCGSPLLRDADAFHPGVYDPGSGETLWFPPLGECRRLL